jgi:NAD(P)-dependent dehydrogenase (short-subunit alcohol dehydrogenase family)
MLDFTGKTVMITGAAGNLGRAVAAAFAGRGARLVLADIDEKRLDAAYPGKRDDRLKCAVDLLRPEAVVDAVAAALKRFGAIDVLAATAGGFYMGDPVHKLPPAAGTACSTSQRARSLNRSRRWCRHAGARAGKIFTIGANAAPGAGGNGRLYSRQGAVIRLTSLSAELRAMASTSTA